VDGSSTDFSNGGSSAWPNELTRGSAIKSRANLDMFMDGFD
jgi:hypothetical protein